MMNELNAYLAQAPIFRHLGEEGRPQRVCLAVEREIVKGEYLVHFGEARPNVSFIQSGMISVFNSLQRGGNRMFSGLEAGRYF